MGVAEDWGMRRLGDPGRGLMPSSYRSPLKCTYFALSTTFNIGVLMRRNSNYVHSRIAFVSKEKKWVTGGGK